MSNDRMQHAMEDISRPVQEAEGAGSLYISVAKKLKEASSEAKRADSLLQKRGDQNDFVIREASRIRGLISQAEFIADRMTETLGVKRPG